MVPHAPGSRFGQVLLMIILRVVEGRQGALEVGGCHNFSGDARSFTWSHGKMMGKSWETDGKLMGWLGSLRKCGIFPIIRQHPGLTPMETPMEIGRSAPLAHLSLQLSEPSHRHLYLAMLCPAVFKHVQTFNIHLGFILGMFQYFQSNDFLEPRAK